MNQDLPKLDDPQPEDKDEGNVHVEKDLWERLSAEVKELLAAIQNKQEWKQMRGRSDTMDCPFCPCRQFGDLSKIWWC